MQKTIVKINSNAMEAQIMHQWEQALPALTAEILADCNQYCKEESGALIVSSLIHTDFQRGIMIWRTPYAKRQYWEIRTAHPDENPQATWMWVHAARRQKNGKWVRKAAHLMGAKT